MWKIIIYNTIFHTGCRFELIGESIKIVCGDFKDASWGKKTCFNMLLRNSVINTNFFLFSHAAKKNLVDL